MVAAPPSRIGPKGAEIVLFNKGGREFRWDRMAAGTETPREFFYGFLELEAAGLSAAMMSSAGAVPGGLGKLADLLERGFARLTGLGVRPFSARLAAVWMGGAKVVISYTDGFSLSLGLGSSRRCNRPILIGGFHGLSDIETRAPAIARPMVRTVIRRALHGLDHLFFFGPADREVAIGRYGIERRRSSVIAFGVDTDFWRPLPETPPGDFVVAVGQDRNRDYQLLAAVPGGHPTVIVTRQNLTIPANAAHITVTAGDFFGAHSMTDEALRRTYNCARAVVVPLRDVWQPSGYSVTLQAMSCGRPVILSNTRGLWNKELLRDHHNCLLVPPGDVEALGRAIAVVRHNPQFATALGQAARQTVVEHFGLGKIAAGTIALARLGLAQWTARMPTANS
jgi:glycosyltransferase involved in cell wall biosynthesis